MNYDVFNQCLGRYMSSPSWSLSLWPIKKERLYQKRETAKSQHFESIELPLSLRTWHALQFIYKWLPIPAPRKERVYE